MSNLLRHAQRELIRAGNGKEYDNHILDMVATYANHGHSGGSAGYTIQLLSRLLSFEPLTPLTGDPEEWDTTDDGDNFLLQNRRCPRVFKRVRDDVCFDVEGYRVIRTEIRSEDNKDHYDEYTTTECRIVTFPYVPHTEVIDEATFLTKPLIEI